MVLPATLSKIVGSVTGCGVTILCVSRDSERRWLGEFADIVRCPEIKEKLFLKKNSRILNLLCFPALLQEVTLNAK